MLVSTLSHLSARLVVLVLFFGPPVLVICCVTNYLKTVGLETTFYLFVGLDFGEDMQGAPCGQLGQLGPDDPFQGGLFTRIWCFRTPQHLALSMWRFSLQGLGFSEHGDYMAVQSTKNKHFKTKEVEVLLAEGLGPQTGPASLLPYSMGQNSLRAHTDLKRMDTDPPTQLVPEVCTEGLGMLKRKMASYLVVHHVLLLVRSPVQKGPCTAWGHVGCLVTDPARGPALKATLLGHTVPILWMS